MEGHPGTLSHSICRILGTAGLGDAGPKTMKGSSRSSKSIASGKLLCGRNECPQTFNYGENEQAALKGKKNEEPRTVFPWMTFKRKKRVKKKPKHLQKRGKEVLTVYRKMPSSQRALLALLTRQSFEMSGANEMPFVITNLNGDNSVFRANFVALPKSRIVTKRSTVSAPKKALSLFKSYSQSVSFFDAIRCRSCQK